MSDIDPNNPVFTPVMEALNELLHTRELEEGRELPPDSPTLADRRRQLDHDRLALVDLVEIPEGGRVAVAGDREVADLARHRAGGVAPRGVPDVVEADPVVAVHDDPDGTLGFCDDQFEFEFALDLILDERVRELIAEENRRMTLVRTGTLYDRARELTGTTELADGNIETTAGMKEFHNLLPIPQTEINLNKDAKLTQNPGYTGSD